MQHLVLLVLNFVFPYSSVIYKLLVLTLHNQCKLKKKCDITVRNQLGQTERKYFRCRTNHSCERSIQLSTEQQTCHMQHTMHFDCRWLSVVDDRPGLCKNILLDLGRKRATDEGYASCCLMIDGMSIKKNVCYNAKEKRMIGNTS
mgnify:FL=1